ncbi:ATPase [Arthrobacter pityocampae]|uniref:ATPase n=1 Tax=Arthrobacter pityocampae TaxID=547334 RepID=A0A2S5IXS5_9MICC|nr:TIR domain-containing protein [Arthrobacter pityocampae]PPB49369.1 ATPase [Arthrobacter pityocampae]
MPSLSDVFPLSGVPTITFVEPVEYARLKVALEAKGRGIVIEGPSGIGKTTAVRRAIEELGIKQSVTELSARKLGDVEVIESLPDFPDAGVVVVDDFHRLPSRVSQKVADYLKTLADESVETTKLVILGINKAGESLISFGRDVAARMEVIRFQREPDDHLREVVRLGEESLNMSIPISDEIIAAANGSFNLVQFLCHDACLAKGITKTVAGPKATLDISFELVNGRIMDRFEAEFGRAAIAFAKGTKLKREGRAPYLHLLKWLGEADEWSIDVDRVLALHSELRGSIGQVVKKGYLTDLINDPTKQLSDLLHYEPTTKVVSVEDPKFYYFIRNLAWSKLAIQVGYLNISFGQTKDFALSFAGADRDVAEALFDALTENELEVFYDKNEQSRILAENVEEYLGPIYRTEASFVVCLLGPEYPNKVWTKFESDAFKARFGTNDVIPVWFADASPGMFDESRKVGGLTFDRANDFQEQIASIVEELCKKIADRRLSAAHVARDDLDAE